MHSIRNNNGLINSIYPQAQGKGPGIYFIEKWDNFLEDTDCLTKNMSNSIVLNTGGDGEFTVSLIKNKITK